MIWINILAGAGGSALLVTALAHGSVGIAAMAAAIIFVNACAVVLAAR